MRRRKVIGVEGEDTVVAMAECAACGGGENNEVREMEQTQRLQASFECFRIVARDPDCRETALQRKGRALRNRSPE